MIKRKWGQPNISAIFFLFLILFGILITVQYFWYNNYLKEEKVSLSLEYYSPTANLGDGAQISYTKSISIQYPKVSLDPENQKSPIVILVHGDSVDAKVFNIYKTQLLRAGCIVVVQNVNFTVATIFELNQTINYFHQNPEFADHPIGVMGHSHGCHYAFYIGFLRADVLSFVIGANFGTQNILYRDYYDYYAHYIPNRTYMRFDDFRASYQFPIQSSQLPNFLVIADPKDPNYETFAYEESIGETSLAEFWGLPAENEQIGDFENRTARMFLTQSSVFVHTSGEYDPAIIYFQLEWIANATRFTLPYTETQILWTIRINWIFVIFLVAIGIYLLITVIHMILQQSLVIEILRKDLIKHSKYESIGGRIDLISHLNLDGLNFNDVLVNLDQKDVFYQNQDLVTLREYQIKFYFQLLITLILVVTVALSGLVFLTDPMTALVYLPTTPRTFLQKIYQLNQFVLENIFFGNLEFNLMLIWGLFFIFYNYVSFDNYLELQFKKKTWKKVGVIALILVELLGSFWIFFNFTIYQWVGYRPESAIFNLILRYMLLYFMTFTIMEFFNNTRAKYDFVVDEYARFELLGKTFLFTIFLFMPLLLPQMETLHLYLSNFMIYILPIGIIFALDIYGIYKRKSIKKLTDWAFTILLLRKIIFSTFLILL